MLFRRFQSEREHRINKMGSTGRILFLALALVTRALGQNHLQAVPPVAGYGPTFDVSFGYSYLLSAIPSAGHVNLNGLDASGGIGFRPHWGVAVDSGYVRTSDVLGTGHTGYVWTLLGGPVFYPVEHRKARLFVRGLVGAGLVDSAVPVNGSRYLHGWVERPAYALGGGIEHSLFRPFGVRLTGDYLRTAYVNPSEVVQLQNNLRLTASIVFRLRDHSR
jgi:hypothetical protein